MVACSPVCKHLSSNLLHSLKINKMSLSRKDVLKINKIDKMSKRFKLDLGIFLHEYAKNTFDCDGFDLLPERNKEFIRNIVINEIDKLLKL